MVDDMFGDETSYDGPRKLASVVVVKQVLSHPNADRLSLAKVKGWQVVTALDEYKAGDLAIYCEIDSILPEKVVEGRPEYGILKEKKFTIKTARFRGELSQGILFPVGLLNNVKYLHDEHFPAHTVSSKESGGELQYFFGDTLLEPGLDVTSILGVTKHEPPIVCVDKFGRPQFVRTFPTHIVPRTDEERVQNIPDLIDKWQGIKLFITEKVDGSSFTCYLVDGQFGVCSRNHVLADNDNVHSSTARALCIEQKLRAAGLQNIALQGELLGPGLQANRYRLQQHTICFFNVYNTTSRQFYNSCEARALVEETLELCWVPVVAEELVLAHSLEELLSLADGKSQLNPNAPREGLVFRALEEARELGFGPISFKCISNEWLLKYDTKVPAESGKNPPQSKVPKNKKKKEEGTGKINTADGTSSTKEVSSA
jgi:RNA ligase (TIGR02306 family)|uniref:RNA ligase domain-containing protein n=1 Tax=Eutreptiella gymnastica TaxID=73025 RepID=A0A7S4CZU9_9EUGL